MKLVSLVLCTTILGSTMGCQSVRSMNERFTRLESKEDLKWVDHEVAMALETARLADEASHETSPPNEEP